MDKQQEICRYLSTVEQATTKEISSGVSFGYYANGSKHLGEILSRMVKSRKIIRVKKGSFKLATREALRELQDNTPVQGGLFDV